MTENTRMNEEQMAEKINAAFPEGITSIAISPRRIFMTINKDILLKLCNALKDEFGFEHVSCVCGVDMKTHFQTVYHISSYSNKVVAEIVVDNIPRDKPEVDSIAPLWGGANWHERETYDMYGIIFKGHPKMERILLQDDFGFFPLRKDYDVGRRVA
ncbi:MAG: F(420)H(2) dehydrogenase subunit C [Methanomassiliicoccales archaeon PtaU1.Bin124]|nr:MAG: F(420)H(2) dehydrogenase subunit C [Methanomassiliicoccales archaeon PtaU1.Bin124]